MLVELAGGVLVADSEVVDTGDAEDLDAGDSGSLEGCR